MELCPGTRLIIPVVREYVHGLKNADELLDMISTALEDQEAKAARGDMLYPDVSCIAILFGRLRR